MVSFSNSVEGVPKKASSLTINPSKDIGSASRGRPNELNTMLTPDAIQSTYSTHTHLSHQWPQPDNIRRFDFMQNKY